DNLSYISRDFDFKILDEDEKGNLYLTQRFEYERDGNWDDTLDNLTLIFKRKPDAKKYKELTGETLKIDRDRMSFSNEDLENLTYYFAHYSGMKDDDIIKTIISTKPLWHKITYEAKDSPLLSFVRGMLKEASSRNLAIDTQDEKIVYHQPSYNDAFVNSILEKYGYLILDGDFSDVKLLSSLEAFKKLSEHKALEPTDAEKKRIKLLDEGVRIVYDSIKKTLINHLKNGPEIKLNLDINDKETIGIFLNNNKFSNKILGEDGYEYWNSFKESSYEFSETTLDKMNDAERSQLVSKIKEGINKNLKEMGETGKIDYDFISELVSKIRVAQYDKKDFIQDIAINEYLVTLQDLCIIREEDISRPKYIFDRHSEVKKDTLGEAIIEYSRYNGHWVDREYLNTADFQQLLGTWIHEICHKSGGDGTTDFTYALTDMLRVLLRSGANLQNAMKLAAIEKVFNKIQD
ncbi:hypothetical protein II906_08070, partial [bacterium]|nr:hypothetical protein [bacterium]